MKLEQNFINSTSTGNLNHPENIIASIIPQTSDLRLQTSDFRLFEKQSLSSSVPAVPCSAIVFCAPLLADQQKSCRCRPGLDLRGHC